MKAFTGKINNIINLDKLGMGLSLLCAIHCLVTPFLMMSLPIMGRYYIAHPWFHVLLALVIIPIGSLAFIKGYRHHRNIRVFLLGIPGLFIITLIPYLNHSLRFSLNEPVWMLVGSMLVIIAHWINRRSCACDSHHHH